MIGSDFIDRNIGEGAMLKAMEDLGFWEGIPKYPWADRLFNMCDKLSDGGVKIISHAGKKCPQAYMGKFMWVKKNFGDKGLKSLHLVSGGKGDAAGRGKILIDDFGKNIKEWQSGGGIAFNWVLRSYDCDENIVRQDLRRLQSFLVKTIISK